MSPEEMRSSDIVGNRAAFRLDIGPGVEAKPRRLTVSLSCYVGPLCAAGWDLISREPIGFGGATICIETQASQAATSRPLADVILRAPLHQNVGVGRLERAEAKPLIELSRTAVMERAQSDRNPSRGGVPLEQSTCDARFRRRTIGRIRKRLSPTTRSRYAHRSSTCQPIGLGLIRQHARIGVCVGVTRCAGRHVGGYLLASTVTGRGGTTDTSTRRTRRRSRGRRAAY